MEVNTPKKILLTYFTNFGFCPINLVCCRVIYKIKKALGENNKYVKYLPLKTNILASNLRCKKHLALLEEIMNFNYEYIISIGQGESFKPCLLERLSKNKDCYVFSHKDIANHNETKSKNNKNNSNKKILDINYNAKSNAGACYVVRDILINHAVKRDKQCKVDFIHIPLKYFFAPASIADFIASKIETLLV